MKEKLKKIASFLRIVFGYGILICLLVGGITFFGYLVALIIGGTTAATICSVIYNHIFPIIFKASTILVLLGLVIMYLSGEKALTAEKQKKTATK